MWNKKIELNVEGPWDRANQALQLYDRMEASPPLWDWCNLLWVCGGWGREYGAFVWSLDLPRLCFLPTQIFF